jgi:hypothetical protein
MGWFLAGLRDGAWLRRGRVLAYARLFLMIEAAAALVLAFASPGGVDGQGRPLGTDFISFFAAGSLARNGTAAAVYDPALHNAAEHAVLQFDDSLYYAFFYPPTYLLLCWLLASFPYRLALFVWQGATACLFAWGLRRIRPAPGTLLVGLAFPACFLCLGHGQNAFLTAALFAGGTVLMGRRPVVAGALLGLLTLKPHLALLVPLALIAGRQWRALAGAIAAALALAATAALVFGPEIWLVYARVLDVAPATLSGGGVDFYKMAGLFGGARTIGFGITAAALVQAIGSVAASVAVMLVWARSGDNAAKAAVLIAGSLVAAPLLLDYDLVILAVAVAWLIVAAEEHGFRPWEKSLFALLFILPLISRPIGAGLAVPLACFAAPAVLILATMRHHRARDHAV